MFLITKKEKKQLDELATEKARFMLADTYLKKHGKSSLLRALDNIENQIAQQEKDVNVLTALVIKHLPFNSVGIEEAKQDINKKYIPMVSKRIKEYNTKINKLHKIEKEM